VSNPIETEPTVVNRCRVVVLNRDLFFGVRIGNLLKAEGYEPEFVKSSAELAKSLGESAPDPALIIVDIGADPDWRELNASLARVRDRPPILAFGPHKDVEALRAAKSAGVTRVVSNSEFHRSALELIRRYAKPAN
jgi:FixJ family two-component response regulator